jgi:hypothetical protein
VKEALRMDLDQAGASSDSELGGIAAHSRFDDLDQGPGGGTELIRGRATRSAAVSASP